MIDGNAHASIPAEYAHSKYERHGRVHTHPHHTGDAAARLNPYDQGRAKSNDVVYMVASDGPWAHMWPPQPLGANGSPVIKVELMAIENWEGCED